MTRVGSQRHKKKKKKKRKLNTTVIRVVQISNIYKGFVGLCFVKKIMLRKRECNIEM